MSERTRWLRRIAKFLKKRTGELGLSSLEDPRSKQGRRWPLKILLQMTLMSLAAGLKSLKQLEELTQQVSPTTRRFLNIPRRIPDTTLRSLLCRLRPEHVIALLDRAVLQMKRRKAFRSFGLPFGVASMDGKATAIPDFDPEFAQLHHHEETGQTFGLLRTITTCLSSDVSRPCIDLFPVPAKSNEMGSFQKAFTQLKSKHGDLFQGVTYDAGAAGQENADCVVAAQKDYLFHIKGDHRLALKMAEQLLGPKQIALAQTETVISHTRSVIRKFFKHKIYDWKHHTANRFHQHFWKHTRTVLRVHSEVWECGKMLSSESRYFVTSLRSHALSDMDWLALVRSHWSVENHCHCTFDKIFDEDNHLWITGDSQGALVVLILRRVVYTLLSVYRSVSLKSEEHHTRPWKTLLRWILVTLIGLNEEAVSGTRYSKLLIAWT
jgi:hypothetical protein